MNSFQHNLLQTILSKNGPRVLHNHLDWVKDEIDALGIVLENCTWMDCEEPQSMDTIIALAVAMDLDRNDRLEMLELLLGFELWWDGEPYNDVRMPASEYAARKYFTYDRPGARSSKDPRITKWKAHVILNYYSSGKGQSLNDNLGYFSEESRKHKKRTQRRSYQQGTNP